MVTQGDRVGLYLSGMPVPIQECNIAVTQPTIKDIVLFGEDEFLINVNLLKNITDIGDSMKKGNSELMLLSDFHVLLVMLKEEPTIKKSILNFFNLIFPDYEVEIEDTSISFSIQEEEETHKVGQITPFNFDNFLNTISDLFEPNINNESEPEYNPANDAAAEIAAKIKRGREKKRQMTADKEGPQSLFGRYTSILAIGLQMDINIFYNYTPFQLYDSFTRFFSKQSSDLYQKVSTTPLMDVSKMEIPPQ